MDGKGQTLPRVPKRKGWLCSVLRSPFVANATYRTCPPQALNSLPLSHLPNTLWVPSLAICKLGALCWCLALHTSRGYLLGKSAVSPGCTSAHLTFW